MELGTQALPPTIPMGLHGGKLPPVNRHRETPRHMALVLQGHRRWALSSSLPDSDAVAAAAGRLLEFTDFCATRGFERATLFLFSDDLCRLPPGGNTELVTTFMRCITAGAQNLHRHDVRLTIEGPISGLDSLTRALLQDVAKRTRLNNGMQLTVAVDSPQFGSRQRGTRNAHNGLSAACQVDFPEFFDEPDQPDFVIRTGGAMPVHRSTVWDTQRTALYFTDILWPNFDARNLGAALAWFGSRHRDVGIQLSAQDNPTLQHKLS